MAEFHDKKAAPGVQSPSYTNQEDEGETDEQHPARAQEQLLDRTRRAVNDEETMIRLLDEYVVARAAVNLFNDPQFAELRSLDWRSALPDGWTFASVDIIARHLVGFVAGDLEAIGKGFSKINHEATGGNVQYLQIPAQLPDDLAARIRQGVGGAGLAPARIHGAEL